MTVIYVCRMIISSDIHFFHFFHILIFWVHRIVKGQKMVQNDKSPQMTNPTPYLMNHTSKDSHLWCKYGKWWYLQVFFSILKFWFSGLSGGWKGKKWPKMTKISVCGTSYFRNHISYDLYLCYTCIYGRIMSPDIFFIFFQNFYFRGWRVGVGW